MISAGARPFFGVDASPIEHAGVRVSESIYPARMRMPRHSHYAAYLGVVLSGGYTESVGGRSRECRPQTTVFHPEGESHSVAFHDSQVRIFRIELAEEWRERIGASLRLPERDAEYHGGPLAALALRLRNEFRRRDQWSCVAIEGLALELVAELGRGDRAMSQRATPRWLEAAREMLESSFRDAPSLVELAEAVGVHPVHLAREFRKHFGCTIGDFVRRTRIEFACRQIARTRLPLSEIALEAGFYDQSHFTNTFRRLVGVTPAAYQRNCRSSRTS